MSGCHITSEQEDAAWEALAHALAPEVRRIMFEERELAARPEHDADRERPEERNEGARPCEAEQGQSRPRLELLGRFVARHAHRR